MAVVPQTWMAVVRLRDGALGGMTVLLQLNKQAESAQALIPCPRGSYLPGAGKV
jgi:hypothetical protein